MLIVALGCGRLHGILDIAAKHPFVVFGTMERERLADFATGETGVATVGTPVYLYETG